MAGLVMMVTTVIVVAAGFRSFVIMGR